MHLPLKCLTYNVRGICDHAKWKLTWHYIYTCKADIVILQEHNQHEFASQTSFFAGFKIMYAGSLGYSDIAMLVNQNLNPLLAYNDPKGRWMVVQ